MNVCEYDDDEEEEYDDGADDINDDGSDDCYNDGEEEDKPESSSALPRVTGPVFMILAMIMMMTMMMTINLKVARPFQGSLVQCFDPPSLLSRL